ncbi:hypothetical protein, partial [Clostridium sp. J1101437_171009_A5]|uniref:hypothetical protein n=1 Tax=Clostridium sp. J1101437_171009_A5 TaxID=2787098 RepID=UPI001A9B7AFA
MTPNIDLLIKKRSGSTDGSVLPLLSILCCCERKTNYLEAFRALMDSMSMGVTLKRSPVMP